MNPILVVLPYHSGDIDLAKKLLEWIAELGSCKPHSLLLCADSKVPQDQMRALMEIAKPVFNQVKTMIVTVPAPEPNKQVWAPNVMFLAAAHQVNVNYRFDFLWLEPDAIPIYPGWLDDIAEEYSECPRRYMGSVIHQEGQPGLPNDYLNGVAVYPNDAISDFEKIEAVKNSTQAFDTGSAASIVPKALHTTSIKHYWGTKELPPVFVEARAPDAPKNHVTLDLVTLEAAIFHRSKDGKLIELLRAKKPRRVLEIIPEPSQASPELPDKPNPQATQTRTQTPRSNRSSA